MTKRSCAAICFLAALSLPSISSGETGSAAAVIKAVVENVFQTLKTYPVSGPPENLPKRREAIKKIVDDNFDSTEMAQRALGNYWKPQSPEKQQEFTRLYYWRLYNFYILRVENYSDEKVLYGNERVAGNKASVATRVSSKKYPEFDIEYRLIKKNEDWKIYDIVIEGVSLTANYRSQFNIFLRNRTFDELLKALRDKAPDSSL